uniref:X-prolyl aminopeptidase (aminopeptidase P) 2, membrane-bound n=1 Tax=Oryzias sinensis TaxID=183150 RepID=A0A8C7ZP77_9TELE
QTALTYCVVLPLLYLCALLLSVTSVGAAANKQAERNCSLTPPYLPSTAVNTSLQLQQLREKMQSLRISAYIIPGTDAHLSEYIASRDARLAFITGFTGSAGTAVVTQSKAVLWTDSRYWVQAERQMDCNWELEKDASISSVAEWLMSELPPGSPVSFDPFLFSLETYQNYASYLESSSLHLEPKAVNLVDVVWGDRPPLSSESIFRLPDRVISMIFFLILIVHLFVWLFNLRGNDIPYNPFFYSYTLLTLNEIWLFVHTERVTKDVEEYLTAHCSDPLCVQLKPYDSVLRDLTTYIGQPGVKVWIGTEYTNYALYEIIPQEKLITSTYSPVLTSKAVKDQTEEQVLRDAHVRDAVAVIQLLMWLEKAVPQGNETELSAAEYVNKLLVSFPVFLCCSPSVETNRRLTVDEMYLVDSGGQYLDGTTDITRTVHWGTPTPMQKEAFTRVLMGNIEISRTVFPSGTRGVNIEMLGRRALWEVGLNYGHGTGHGVGNYFGVHEWPVGFQTNNIPFRAGMFTSIEPGYYKENDFGIRIEDIAVTVPAQTKYGNNYLTFDTVSLVPYDRKLIDIALLSSEQLQWLNNYYMTIRQLVGPELVKQGLHEENDWMLKNTDPFPEFGSSASICSSSLTLIALAVTLFHSVD